MTTTKTLNTSEDQIQILLIVVLIGAILYMLTKRLGGICSLVRPRERFIIGGYMDPPYPQLSSKDLDKFRKNNPEGIVSIEDFPYAKPGKCSASCFPDTEIHAKGGYGTCPHAGNYKSCSECPWCKSAEKKPLCQRHCSVKYNNDPTSIKELKKQEGCAGCKWS